MTIKQVRVYAPGSIANLGPGFDVFGLAIEGLGDHIKLSIIDEPEVRIKITGIDSDKIPENKAYDHDFDPIASCEQLIESWFDLRPSSRSFVNRSPELDVSSLCASALCERRRNRGSLDRGGHRCPNIPRKPRIAACRGCLSWQPIPPVWISSAA